MPEQLLMNEHIIISEHDSFIYHEMMTHPALFTHPQPKKIAITGNAFGMLQEVMKHVSIQEVCCVDNHSYLHEAITHYFLKQQQENDPRIQYPLLDINTWLSDCAEATYDIIIQAEPSQDFLADHFKTFFRLLKSDGILIQPFKTSLLHLPNLKSVCQNVQQAGFHASQLLNFPQPSFGWRTILMATKQSLFKRIREKDIFNRPFTTRYYNFDMHRAALALPEFAQEMLEKMQ